MRIILFTALMLCIGMLFCGSVAADTGLLLTGRTVYRDDEAIALRVTGGNAVTLQFSSTGGRSRTLTVPITNGMAVVTVTPYALSPGEWTLTANGQPTKFTITSSIPNTPFTIGVYQANLVDEIPSFYLAKTVSAAERLRGWRDIYGVNLMMLQGGGFPVDARTIDLLQLAETEYTTLNTLAGQHQPDGSHNDWSDPETVESILYRAKHLAQYLRPYAGFGGVHYADEPGLTWGIETPDGKMYDMGERKRGEDDYLGPMAVPVQRAQYTQRTGKPAPNWRQPEENLDAWMDFIRWRTTILGNVFAQATQAVKEVDPKLIGYGQIYEWSATATDGCYPPEEARGVDVLSTHAYTDRQLGMWYPAHETDAMRSGAWDKPLWMMPTWAMGMMPEDGVRACVYSTLAQKVEGLVWPLDWMYTWPQAEEVSKKILPISGMLYQTEKLREGVGILHSREQHIYAFSKDVTDWHGGKDYVGRLNTAWLMTIAAHYPTSRVVEEEVLAGKVGGYAVLLAPGLTFARPELIKALEQYIAKGGTVVLDGSATVQIAGAKTLPFTFIDWFNSARKGEPEWQDWTDRKRFDTNVAPYLAAFTKALAPHVRPVAQCDNPLFMVTAQGGNKGRYLWVVNMAQEDREAERKEEGGYRRPRWFMTPATGTVTLPEGEYVAYDVFAGKLLAERTVKLSLDKGAARCYALLPTAIEAVKVNVKWHSPALSVDSGVMGKADAIDAVVPVQVTLTAPDKTVFRTVYRATQRGNYCERLPLGHAAQPGQWAITVTELLSGKSGSAQFTVAGSTKAFATTAPVDVFDTPQIARALGKNKGEVLLLAGDAAGRANAEKLAAVLKAQGVTVKVDDAVVYLKERAVTRHTCRLLRGAGLPLAINQQVVLLGNTKTNPLIARVVQQYQLCPRPLGPGYPGKGRALLYWVQGMFGLNNDIVLLCADDADGLAQGVNAIEEIIREKTYRVQELSAQ